MVGRDGGWPFLHRDDQVRRVADALEQGMAGVLLFGQPGAGRRTLAAKVAERLRPGLSLTVVEAAHAVTPSRAERLLADRGAEQRFALIGTQGRSLAPAFAAAVTGERMLVVPVAPFRRDQLAAVLERALGAPVGSRTVGELWRAAGGNLALLRQIVQGARETGALGLSDGAWILAGDLRSPRSDEWLAAALVGYSPAHRQALETVALREPVPFDDLSEEVAVRVGDLAADGLLDWERSELGGGMLRMRSPLLAAQLRRTVDPIRERSVHRDALDRARGRARHGALRSLLWAQSQTSVPLAALLDGAELAARVHDYELAAALATAVIDREGATSSERVAALVGRAFALRFGDRPTEALRDLQRAAGLSPGPDDDARVAVLTAEILHYGRGDVDGALAVLDSAAATPAVAGHRLLHLAYAGRFREFSAADPAVLDGPIRQRVSYAAALARIAQGRPAAGLAALLAEPAPVAADGPWLVEEYSAAVALTALAADGPVRIAQWDLARDPGEADPFVRFQDLVLQTGAALAALLEGDGRAALERGLGAVASATVFDPSGFAAVALAMAAEAAALVGDRAMAARLAAQLTVVPRRASAVLGQTVEHALVLVQAAAGSPKSAITRSLAAAARYRAEGLHGWEARMLQLALRLGHGDAAAELVELAPVLDGAVNAALVAQARAQAAIDPLALAAAADRWEQLGMRLIAAECLLGAAVLARDAGRNALATELGDRGALLLARLGVGAGPTVPLAPAPRAVFTPREHEIAELMMGRASNAEIAERLHLSRRTVEAHVGRIYGKLGISGRSEVAARLRR